MPKSQPLKNNNVNVSAFFESTAFVGYTELDESILSQKGIYCIRLKSGSLLPDTYQTLLDDREYKYIYIGISKDSLGSRLKSEILHKTPGTFFRSIGTLLGFTPMPGSLIGKKNKNNIRFSAADTKLIIDWLFKNVEIAIISYDDLKVERDLIKYYKPLLNITHNPNKCQDFIEVRRKCLAIARGNY